MKKILVGFDGSPRSAEVLATAVRLAKANGAKLTLVRAVAVPVEIPLEAYSMPPAQVGPLLEREALKQLQAAAESLPTDVRGELKVGVGTPWQVVCEMAKKIDADLIIVGSHGYGVIDRLIGTTAAKIVNHADRSVLVVRAAEKLV